MRANTNPTGSKQHANGIPIMLIAKHREIIAKTAEITADANEIKSGAVAKINTQTIPTNPPHGSSNEIAHSIEIVQIAIHIIVGCKPTIRYITVGKTQMSELQHISDIAHRHIMIHL